MSAVVLGPTSAMKSTDEPTTPTNPDNPDNPDQPTTPTTPTNPENPSQPSQPGTSGEKGNAGEKNNAGAKKPNGSTSAKVKENAPVITAMASTGSRTALFIVMAATLLMAGAIIVITVRRQRD